MHTFGLAVFFLIAAIWVLQGFRAAASAKKLPWVKDFAPAQDAESPSISFLFAARDEEEKLPAALATLAELDYPNLEIIAVDDRSVDATGRILVFARCIFRSFRAGGLANRTRCKRRMKLPQANGCYLPTPTCDLNAMLCGER
jgi:hypothetical protein